MVYLSPLCKAGFKHFSSQANTCLAAADTEDELRALVESLGIKWARAKERVTAEGHVQLVVRMRERAIELGAVAVSWAKFPRGKQEKGGKS
jgi:hypothetical protein